MLAAFRTYLDTLNPALWPLLLTAVSWGFVAAWRKLHRASFDKLPIKVQAVPATLFALAVSGTAAQGDFTKVAIDTILAAVMGQAAIGVHHSVKNMRRRPEGGSVTAATADQDEDTKP